MPFASKILHAAILTFCFFPNIVKTQTLEGQAEGGALMPSTYRPSDSLLKRSSYQAATLAFTWHADTARVYTRIQNNPAYGLSFYAGTFHNKSIGEPLAISFFIKTPVYENKRWKFFYLISAGIAWNFSAYDASLNASNWLTGTRENMIGYLCFGTEYRILPKLAVGGAVGYRHFSNGAVKWPNYGINIIPFSLHADLDLRRNRISGTTRTLPVFMPFNSFAVFCAPSSKGWRDGSNYLAGTFGLLWMRQINYRIGWGGGFDLFFNASGYTKVHDSESDLLKMLSGGLYTSINWMFTEKFFLNIGSGLYLWRHPANDENFPLYERISARYMFTKHLLAGVGIKINGNVSDYIEWTLGYVFSKDRNIYRLAPL